MYTAEWWLLVAMAVIPVFAIGIGAIAFSIWLDRRIEEEESRHLPPAE